MKYKNKKSKLNIICVLFIFLLNSSIASAQTVEVTEKTPAQLIYSANVFLKQHNKNLTFSEPVLDSEYAAKLNAETYSSILNCQTPLKVILVTEKSGAISQVLIVGDYVTPDLFANSLFLCVSSLYRGIGMNDTDVTTMFNSIKYDKIVTCDAYSISMKRRYLTFSTIVNKKFFVAIYAKNN